MNRNTLLPIILMGIVGLVIFFLTEKMGGTKSVSDDANAPPLETVMGEQPASPAGIEENYEETHSAEQADYLETTKTVAANQRALEKRLDGIVDEVSASIIDKVTNGVREKSESQFSLLKETLEKNKDHIMLAVEEKLQSAPKQQVVIDDEGNLIMSDGMPGGLGFDDLPVGGTKSSRKTAVSKNTKIAEYAAKKRGDKFITLAPVGARYDHEGGRIGEEKPKKGKDSKNGLKKVRFSKTDNRDKNKKAGNNQSKESDQAIPYYTMPINATLISNTTLTALMGVVPVKGVLNNPIRFKVITGGENIATNGHYLPDVKDIVWSGTASGNREMHCVRGVVDSVTFTFNDGTIYSQVAKDQKLGLGYIAGPWGKQCIPGTLISNSNQYLTNRVVVAGAASLSEATSESNVTKVKNLDNELVSSFVNDNTSQFIAGETLSGSLKEFSQYLKERQLDAIDLVFIHTGEDVAIHLEEQINIDYDPVGRRLVHHENFAIIDSTYID